MSKSLNKADDSSTEESSSKRTIFKLAHMLGVILTLLAVAEGLDLYRAMGVVMMKEQLLGVILGLGLLITFISAPAKRGSERLSVPWYDWILAVVSFACCLYFSFNYIAIMNSLFEKPLMSLIAAGVIVFSVIECVRRTAGPLLFYFVLFFIAFGLIGNWIPGEFQGRDVHVDRLIVYLGFDPNGIVGLPLAVVASVVIPFILFGNLLNLSGGSQFFTEISTALMGSYRGGSAKIAILASTLFGCISGSAVANVVSTGVITIPLMKKGGYPADKAAAIEAVASTGGQLMPPMMGASAFLMAEFLQVPFKEIILAALIPAALYYISLFIQADLYAGREGIKPVENIPFKALEVLAKGWLYISPFSVIIIGLFAFNLNPQSAAIYATALLILIAIGYGYRKVRMPWKNLYLALSETGMAVTQLIMVSAMSGIVIGVLNITGLGFALTQGIIELAGGHLGIILLLAAAISIVLGMGMPTIGVYLLLATLVVPSLVQAGVPEIAAHMFAFYFGILSMITPPVAAAAFAAATIGKSDFIKTGIAAVAFGWPAYVVPFIFTLEPAMLWQGTPIEIARIAVLSVVGVFMVSAGWIGFFSGPLTKAWRLVFVLSGVACLLPATASETGMLLNIAGVTAAVVLISMRKTNIFEKVAV